MSELQNGNVIDKFEFGVRRALGWAGLSRTSSLITTEILDRVDSLISDDSLSNQTEPHQKQSRK